ncbi:WW domain [Seminavis robusta]|uniref:WW domain n=1 Tax=Seminavis robusta TaxID=568900 RepID=A0A9N8DC55_9STRA|nr:WW domain [Seminavis robusta]|eukprot:Sro30_g019730.1 WW domain (324) ;mRNA; r:115746-116717
MPEPQPQSSYDAFNSVDKLVSKPILGSDGAASWQEFRNDNKKTIYKNKESSAPLAPLKKADKLGSGLTSWSEERSREEVARQEAGHAELGKGYTNFKAKNEDPQARKEKKRIEERRRPDNIEYFLPAKAFDGWKWDYIFTTKEDRGTGYYWDGSDSLKRLKGELPATAGPDNLITSLQKNTTDDTDEAVSTTTTTTTAGKHNRSTEGGDDEQVKAKKKKKRKKAAPVIVDDPNNPLEQVQAAIRKRNERLGISNDDGLPDGWEAAPDPSTGKVYYFHRQSGTRQWEKPKNERLPEGWNVAQDKTTGKTYYFHTSGETRWEKPT